MPQRRAAPTPVPEDIWGACRGPQCLQHLRVPAMRVVEAQHIVSTRKLVDSDEEQRLLEEMLDAAKPPAPGDAPPRLHYLLATPFRYPPLPWGSRFGSRQERGIWYGATRARTSLAEVAFYKLLLLEGTTAVLTPLVLHLSLITADIETQAGIYLTQAPFDTYRPWLVSKMSYDATQRLGSAMRAAAVGAFVFWSARDPGGVNVAVLAPHAFAKPHLAGPPQTWACVVDNNRVEFSCTDFTHTQTHAFARDTFLVNGRLVLPS